MEALATVVFERTPKGAVAIKSTGDEVPRQLRTLLLAVDGRSPVAQYVPFLTAFAPLSEKFAELEDMGFLKRKGNVTSAAVDRFEKAQSSGFGALLPRIDATAAASGFVPIQESDLRAMASNPFTHTNSNVVNAFELELQALARQMSVAAPTGTPEPASQPAQVRAFAPADAVAPAKPQLRDLLREMERFLSRSAGAEALPVILMLEQIQTIDQLRGELAAYIELVQRYGPDADLHIERLAEMLSSV
jgi:hypothetical protein